MKNRTLMNVIFWLTYLVTATAAWLHSYQVFLQSDTPIIAALAATSIDGVLALTLYIMGRVRSESQRNTALIGTVAFAIISATAQVIQRFTGLGVEMPAELRVISLFLVPIATTASLVLLGVIKYFDKDGDGKPDFMQQKQKSQQPSQQSRPDFSSYQQAPSQHQLTGQGASVAPIQQGTVATQATSPQNGNRQSWPVDQKAQARIVSSKPQPPFTQPQS